MDGKHRTTQDRASDTMSEYRAERSARGVDFRWDAHLTSLFSFNHRRLF